MVSKNPRRKVRGRLDVALADGICEVAESQATNMTEQFNWAFKKSKMVFK